MNHQYQISDIVTIQGSKTSDYKSVGWIHMHCLPECKLLATFAILRDPKYLHHSCGLWFVRLSVKIVKPNPPPRYWQSEGYFERMAGITLDECIQEFNLSDDILDTKCSDEHILAVSSFLDWKGVARYLKLTDSDVGAVESDGRDEQDKRHKTLQKWMSKFAFKATYRNLIQALLDSGRGDHAEKVCKLLQKDVLGSQEAAAIGQFEEKNARDSGEPRQKYRRVLPPEDEQQKFRMNLLRAEIDDLKEQLQAKKDELLQKGAKLSALQVQLRDSKSDFQTFQAQLGLPLKLNWKRSSHLPFAMYSSTTRPVTLKGKVYMVGRRIGVAEGTVVVYDTYSGKWSSLPKYHDQIKSFGMAVIKNQLTLVGGFDQLNHKVTNKLAVWESEWTFPYPPMPTARYDVAVATYNEWMAVAGGQGDNGYLDSVEILNSTEKQWYSAAPLPMGCIPMKSAVVRDEWYLTECYNPTVKIDPVVGFAVSLPALILLRGNARSTLWRNIPIPPLNDTAALATRDLLFAVGGRTRSTKIISSAIHLYLPWKKKWIEAGRLQTERASCTCIELPSGEILVAGGSEPKCDGPSLLFTHTNQVDIATFMDL